MLTKITAPDLDALSLLDDKLRFLSAWTTAAAYSQAVLVQP